MRFPGRRKHKHYFPVHERDPLLHHAGLDVPEAKVHVVGIDQTLVDVDARVPDELLGRYEEEGGKLKATVRVARGRLVADVDGQMAFDLRKPGEDGRWHLRTKRGTADVVDVVIAATGVLHHPNIPTFEGMDRFEGSIWDAGGPMDAWKAIA